MEAKKTRDLLSANRRPRKICGVIQSESEGLRIQSADGVSSDLGLKACETSVQWLGEDGHPSSSKRKCICPSSALLFYLDPQWAG